MIDFVATDHSPCTPAMKRREEGRWDLAWGGIASLGVALPVLWTAMRQRGYNTNEAAERIAKWMSAGPARLAGWLGRKGTLAAGADADFAVFDPDATWTVTAKDLHFRHKTSPYLGANAARAGRGDLAAWRAHFLLESIRRQATRQRVGSRMSDRAKRAIEECRTIATMSEDAGPHHAPLSDSAISRGSCSICARGWKAWAWRCMSMP